MSSINFNEVTKEIELIGSESFIEANFHLVQDLWVTGLKKNKLKRTKATKVSKSFAIAEESKIAEPIVASEALESPVKLSSIETEIPEPPQESVIVRPPVRKYFDLKRNLIRSEYKSIATDQPVVGMGKSVPAPVSNRFFISSLKESLGVSQDLVEGIIRDAEREGRVRSNSDGSYDWL